MWSICDLLERTKNTTSFVWESDSETVTTSFHTDGITLLLLSWKVIKHANSRFSCVETSNCFIEKQRRNNPEGKKQNRFNICTDESIIQYIPLLYTGIQYIRRAAVTEKQPALESVTWSSKTSLCAALLYTNNINYFQELINTPTQKSALV